MTDEHAIRYADAGDVQIAYRTWGDGPLDIVVTPDWAGQCETDTDNPGIARLIRRLGSVARVIRFDKRGIGLSDPVPIEELSSLEGWMDDLRAVLDAIGSERAALLGMGYGGQMAMVFAASEPERVASLILVNAYAWLGRDDDYRWGFPPQAQQDTIERIRQGWGSGVFIDTLSPSSADDEEIRRWWCRSERLAASPNVAAAMERTVFDTDVRHVLDAIKVPTLVLHASDNRFIQVGHGRYLADHIDGAEYVEIPGVDHWFWAGDSGSRFTDAIEEFFTGAPAAPPEPDRVLTTVLFTDIVSSTQQAAELGDRRWRDVLDDLDRVMERQVERFDGRLVKHTGDGYLATFDGPGRAIRCAQALREGARSLDLRLRTGVHTGEVERRGDDISGIAVHLTARVMAEAGAGEVLVSSAVPPLVAGSGIEFDNRGIHELAGIPGEWQLFVAV